MPVLPALCDTGLGHLCSFQINAEQGLVTENGLDLLPAGV